MEYEIAGKTLKCPHCESTEFKMKFAHLDTSTFRWLGLPGRLYVCQDCGRIEWFHDSSVYDSPKHLDMTDTDCLACGEKIPGGETKCSKCGWSYEDQ